MAKPKVWCFRCGREATSNPKRCNYCGSVAFLHGSPRPWPFRYTEDEITFVFPRMPGRRVRIDTTGVGA